MPGGDVFADLLSLLDDAIDIVPDPRIGKNNQYTMRDITLSAFAVFFSQSPSFLAHQRLMQQARGMNNAHTIFSVDQLPGDTQIRNILDTVDPVQWRSVFRNVYRYLDDRGVIDTYRDVNNTLLVPLDGTGYFYSERIHCPSCTVSNHRDGRVSYTHTVLMPAIVKPHCAQVVPLEPEFIVPQDGREKQDCEREAAKRWIDRIGAEYASSGITLLGDDIYACSPIINRTMQHRLHFIFVAKPQSHKYLYEEIASLDKLGEVSRIEQIRRRGKKKWTYHYRYVNDVMLIDQPDERRISWAELTIIDETGNVTFRVAFVTDHRITDENVADVIQAGRCRWKIENEDFNTLKTKGYHFEHNFGHGKQYLSQTLLSLNTIAFLFHTVLELLDEQYAMLRKMLPRRDTLFQHIAALTQYLCFAGWQSLLTFMLRGIQQGPVPPPDPHAMIE